MMIGSATDKDDDDDGDNDNDDISQDLAFNYSVDIFSRNIRKRHPISVVPVVSAIFMTYIHLVCKWWRICSVICVKNYMLVLHRWFGTVI